MESMRHSSLSADPSQVPSSKVARRYQAPSQAAVSSAACSALGMGPPASRRGRSRGVSARGAKSAIVAQEQPAEPDALALAALADPVHAVVPVAGADQRQAMGAGQGEALVEAARAMLEQRRRLVGLVGLEEGVVLAGRERRAVEERHALVQHRRRRRSP